MDNLDKQHITNVNNAGTISNVLPLPDYANIAPVFRKTYFNLKKESRTLSLANHK